MRKLAALLTCGILAVPTLALAGKKATAGDQTLQISSSLAPAKTKAKGATIKLNVDYESTNADAQVKENTKSVVFTLPAGTKLNPTARAQCKYSELANKDTGGPNACPAGSKVGQGTATADARPTLPDPVNAEVTMFNGLDDTNPDGSPRDPAVPAVLLYAKTSIGVNVALPFDIHANRLELDYAPPAEGSTQLFHLQKVNITIAKGVGKPYARTPSTCKRTWLTSMTIANFDGPSVTATSTQKCHK
jgi:hypothetical protein